MLREASTGDWSGRLKGAARGKGPAREAHGS